jgi:hypothetical protein
MRITSKAEAPNGVIEWEAVAEDGSIYSMAGVGGTSSYVPQTITEVNAGGVQLVMIDSALVSDLNDDAGFYIAASAPCVIYRSADGGITYSAITSLSTAATMGGATTVLGDFSGGNIFDESNTVTVRLSNGSLSSDTRLNVLSGSNTALIGRDGRWEEIRLKNATLIATDTYVLSGLLRGRRGTEHAMASHTAGDTFILVESGTLGRVVESTAGIGVERYYKAVPVGGGTATVQRFTNDAVGLEPYAPVLLGGGRNDAGDVAINWRRRTRVSGAWRDLVEVSLGEDTESYSVDVYDDNTYTTVVRTLTSSTPTVTYTAAQQTTDFGGLQTTVYAKVYQVSADVGRGYPLTGSV